MQQFLEKSSNKKWSTMIELIAMMAIMGLWIWSMLWVIGSGTNFAKDTEDTIKAINLAREWIEWVTNWRDTNWLRFSSDKSNCWKVKDYVSTCIWNTLWTNDILTGAVYTWSFLLYTKNGAWYLLREPDIDYITDWSTYRSTYQAWLDNEWFYTQTGVTIPTVYCSSLGQPNCMTPFNREIVISAVWTGKLLVSSIVRWQWRRMREVTLTTILTNWKAKF